MFSIPEFCNKQALNKPLIVLEMRIAEITNQIYIKLMIDEKQHLFTVKMHEIGIALPSGLENIITINIDRCRAFAKLVENFREGKKIKFPVKID